MISPLLANIVLNQLDWALDRAGFQFARYAADFVVLTRSERQAQEALALVQLLLATLQLTAESGENPDHDVRKRL